MSFCNARRQAAHQNGASLQIPAAAQNAETSPRVPEGDLPSEENPTSTGNLQPSSEPAAAPNHVAESGEAEAVDDSDPRTHSASEQSEAEVDGSDGEDDKACPLIFD